MIKKYHFHNFYCFSLQNLTPVENQLHRKIERKSLYRTVYATYSVNFNFAFKKLRTLFLVSFVLVPVTHMLIGEKSIEICFLIEFWMRYTNLSSILNNEVVMLNNDKNTEKCRFFKENGLKKCFYDFSPISRSNRGFFYTKMISKKFSTNPPSFIKFWDGRCKSLEEAGGITLLLFEWHGDSKPSGWHSLTKY